ncbi:fidgetin isoform X1 [Onychostoma macrolepis]|uniref:fidgetin isoform X1 n=1 Tax=Onychostoma macrolepis TaxID=369639 RepID=UPI00272A505C|nr:fidgetin isoform X1 [Onychostoma macrolepis]
MWSVFLWWSVSPALTWKHSRTSPTRSNPHPLLSAARLDAVAVLRRRTGVTMQWSPEQSQWAEQHYDITSTTRSPGHKIEALRDPRLTGSTSAAAYQHSWANDDISALTASNLLKRYAERYSAILDLPCESGLMGYPDTAISVSVRGPGVVNNGPPLLNGRKVEAEPWLESVYPPLGCVPELLPKAPLSVTDVSVSACNSPVIGSGSLPEPCFSSSGCNGQTGNQEYSSTPYSTPFLQPVGTYGGSLFHPTPSHASLVSTYNANTSPNLAAYSYPNTRYPSQAVLPAGYSPPPPPSAYLPAGITPPNPLPAVGYSYPATSVSESDAPSASSLSKSYYPSTQSEIGVFEEYDFGGNSNSDSRSEGSPLYRPSGDETVDKQNGFNRTADVTSSSFKPANHGDSLRSLETLTVAMSGRNNGTSGQHFPSTSTSVVTSHQHLCLDTNTP